MQYNVPETRKSIFFIHARSRVGVKQRIRYYAQLTTSGTVQTVQTRAHSARIATARQQYYIEWEVCTCTVYKILPHETSVYLASCTLYNLSIFYT